MRSIPSRVKTEDARLAEAAANSGGPKGEDTIATTGTKPPSSATRFYSVVPDRDAERDGDLRVVDESGEDYLFSADRFVPIEVPAAVRASLLRAALA